MLNREKSRFIDILISKKTKRLLRMKFLTPRLLEFQTSNLLFAAHILLRRMVVLTKHLNIFGKSTRLYHDHQLRHTLFDVSIVLNLGSKKKKRLPLNPIISRGTFHHIVIDLIDYSNKPAGPNNLYHYIVHAVDHFSTFHYTDALPAKTAFNVLRFIQRMFSITGYPCVLHSDNGSEFKNELVDNYLELHNVEHRRGKAASSYHAR